MKAAERLFWLALALIALLAVALTLLSTRYGPGVGGDATVYLASARGLLDGIGLGYIDADGSFRLLPYFAPFFPLVLAFFGLFGLNLVTVAHWLNVLLYGGLVMLAGGTLYGLTRRKAAALLLALPLAFSPILLPVYSWAMSEPLSLMLGFAGLWLAFRAAETPETSRLFWLSAVCAGLSFLTRYAAVAFVGAGALALLLRGELPWTRRLRDALLYGASAGLPVVVWVFIGMAQTASVGSRSLESGAGMAARLAGFVPLLWEALLGWWIPFSWIEAPPYPALFNRLLLPALAAVVSAAAAWLYTRRIERQRFSRTVRWALLLAVFGLLYLLVIMAVYVTTYPPITIENRMLAPLYVAAFWLLVTLAALLIQRSAPARWLAPAVLLGLALFAGWNGWRAARIAAQNYQTGLGYNALAWRNSATLAAVKALPPCTPIVTNEVTALMFLAQRKPFALAEIYRSTPLDASAFTRYGDGNAEGDPAEALFHSGEAQLVLFDTLDAQLEGIYGQQTAARINALVDGLTPVFEGEDGTIYVYPER